MKVKIDYIFSGQCPAPWSTTPDANCLCCDYLQGLTLKNFAIKVECSYKDTIKELYFPYESRITE